MAKGEQPGCLATQDEDDPLAGVGSGDLGDADFEAFLDRMDRILSSMVGEE